jgi:tetratricopeptide (TPR) repeat protein
MAELMKMIVIRRSLAALALVASCTPALSKETIRNHPRINVTVLEPQIIERSAPFPPAWTLRPDRGAVAYVSFTGQASGSSIDAAKSDAERDLLSSIASFISVEVESEFEASESEATKGGQTRSSFEARSLVRTKAKAELEGVKPDELYWEKIAASPLATSDVSYRCHVYARVPKAEIDRARLKKLLARQQRSGKRMVVVLPFRPALASADLAPLAQAFAEELSRHLQGAPGIHVSDPGLVAALLATGRSSSEAEAIEVVKDALLPDLIVAGTYQLHQGRLRVSFTIHGHDRAPAPKTVEKPYTELFALEDLLIREIRAGIGLEPGSELERPKSAVDQDKMRAAFEAHHAAFASFSAGKNEAAIAQLELALALRPNYPEAEMRLGRVLERLGKYGRVPPHQESRFRTYAPLVPCTPWGEIADEDYDSFIVPEAPRFAGEITGERPLLDTNVDHVLSAAAYFAGGGPMPEPKVPAIPNSAVGAYWNALQMFALSGDRHGQMEAAIAIADLGVRVDRLEAAEKLYQWIASTSGQDLHFKSLAELGLGKVHRAMGSYQIARTDLQRALSDRAQLGEKPYLVEIYNELGGLEVEVANYAQAYAWYERALHLADDLNDDYFRAVLANNVGVLLLINGETARADRYFQQAWDHLKDLAEGEGQISSGLNVSQLSGLKGDRERAIAYLKEVDRIVHSTAQEGRMGELYDHRGAQAAAQGEAIAALRDLIRGYALFERLSRYPDSLRLRANALVADYLRFAEAKLAGREEKSRLRCLKTSAATILSERWELDRQTQGLSLLFARLNGETLQVLEP